MVNFEVAWRFRAIKKTFRDGGAAEPDIDDSIKRNRFRVSLKNVNRTRFIRRFLAMK